MSNISPNLKGQVAIEFSVCHCLILAPGETIGTLGDTCPGSLGLGPTLTRQTRVVIRVAVVCGLLVTKFHLRRILQRLSVQQVTHNLLNFQTSKTLEEWILDISFCNRTLYLPSSSSDQIIIIHYVKRKASFFSLQLVSLTTRERYMLFLLNGVI